MHSTFYNSTHHHVLPRKDATFAKELAKLATDASVQTLLSLLRLPSDRECISLTVIILPTVTDGGGSLRWM